MFGLEPEKEEKIKASRKRVNQIEYEIALLEAKMSALFEEMNLTPQQVIEFAKERKNFSQESWENMEKLREEHGLAPGGNHFPPVSPTQAPPPKKKPEVSSEQVSYVQPHWLHVR